jgi:hypothetical protein
MVLPMNQIVKEDALAVQKSMVITFLEQAIQHAESISGENR